MLLGQGFVVLGQEGETKWGEGRKSNKVLSEKGSITIYTSF